MDTVSLFTWHLNNSQMLIKKGLPGVGYGYSCSKLTPTLLLSILMAAFRVEQEHF
jgi:hypothetical protein